MNSLKRRMEERSDAKAYRVTLKRMKKMATDVQELRILIEQAKFKEGILGKAGFGKSFTTVAKPITETQEFQTFTNLLITLEEGGSPVFPPNSPVKRQLSTIKEEE